MNVVENPKSKSTVKTTIDIVGERQDFCERIEEAAQNFNDKDLLELIDYAEKIKFAKT